MVVSQQRTKSTAIGSNFSLAGSNLMPCCSFPETNVTADVADAGSLPAWEILGQTFCSAGDFVRRIVAADEHDDDDDGFVGVESTATSKAATKLTRRLLCAVLCMDQG